MAPKDPNFSEQLVSISKLISEMLEKISGITSSNSQYKSDISNLRTGLSELKITVDELHGITFDSAEKPSIVARLVKIESIIQQLKSFSQAIEESEIVHNIQETLETLGKNVEHLTNTLNTIESTMKSCALCRKPKEYHEDLEAVISEYREKKTARSRFNAVIDQVKSGVLVVVLLLILGFIGRAMWLSFQAEVHSHPAADIQPVDPQKKHPSP